jgi:hypothetical protein
VGCEREFGGKGLRGLNIPCINLMDEAMMRETSKPEDTTMMLPSHDAFPAVTQADGRCSVAPISLGLGTMAVRRTPRSCRSYAGQYQVPRARLGGNEDRNAFCEYA